jgi:hypothetical protein
MAKGFDEDRIGKLRRWLSRLFHNPAGSLKRRSSHSSEILASFPYSSFQTRSRAVHLQSPCPDQVISRTSIA